MEEDKTRELIPTNEKWKRMDVMDNIRLGNINPAIRFNNYVGLCDMRLKLWMFVPCDKEGNVLERPKECISDTISLESVCPLTVIGECKCKEYRQARSRVIFEGFEMKYSINGITITNGKIEITIDPFYVLSKDGLYLKQVKTIQDLVNLGLTIRQEAAEIYDL